MANAVYCCDVPFLGYDCGGFFGFRFFEVFDDFFGFALAEVFFALCESPDMFSVSLA
jgi:hypothetical protein